jgi:hypothetical protein
VSGNPSTSRMRVGAHDLQTTINERAFFALISPRVVRAPLPDLRARFIRDRISLEPARALHRLLYGQALRGAVTATVHRCAPTNIAAFTRLALLWRNSPLPQARWQADGGCGAQARHRTPNVPVGAARPQHRYRCLTLPLPLTSGGAKLGAALQWGTYSCEEALALTLRRGFSTAHPAPREARLPRPVFAGRVHPRL